MRDDSEDPSNFPADPDLLKLPTGLASSGDPVAGNPFREGTLRHDIWTDATRRALERIERIKADWLASAIALAPPHTFEEILGQTAEYKERSRRLTQQEFHVWAERLGQVIFTDYDLQSANEWLVGYAEAVLTSHAGLMQKHGLSPPLIDAELRLIRDELTSLVLHYKAENRRCQGLRQQEVREFQDKNASEAGGSPSRRESKATTPLARNVDRLRRECGWSYDNLARRSGLDKKTILGHVNQGKGAHPKTVKVYADAFSKALGRRVTVEEMER